MKSHEHEPHTEPVHSQLDEWHQHALGDGLPQTEHGAHANIGALLATFIIITVATVVFSVVIGLFMLSQVSALKGETEMTGLDAMAAEAAAYKEEALAAQTGYAWTADGNVRIPIEQAMAKVVAANQEHPGQ
jgi:hypothetical protein